MFVCVIAVAVCASLNCLSLSLTHTHTNPLLCLRNAMGNQRQVKHIPRAGLMSSWQDSQGRIPQSRAFALQLQATNFMNTSNTRQSIFRTAGIANTHLSVRLLNIHCKPPSYFVTRKCHQTFVRHVCGSPSSVVHKQVPAQKTSFSKCAMRTS